MLILANNHQPPFNVDISFRCSRKKNQIVFYTDADMYIYKYIFLINIFSEQTILLIHFKISRALLTKKTLLMSNSYLFHQRNTTSLIIIVKSLYVARVTV